MVRFLLLPEDEREFLEWAVKEHGLVASSVAVTGTGLARLVPLSEPVKDLPGPLGQQGPDAPRELVLRTPGWGINDLVPWDTTSAVARVMDRLNSDAADKAGVSLDALIDLERTRLIRFHRCGWTRAGELHVAALAGSARPARLQDPAVSTILKSAVRWMSRGAAPVESPDHVRYRPRILARPQAYDWVQSGGVVYSWDA